MWSRFFFTVVLLIGSALLFAACDHSETISTLTPPLTPAATAAPVPTPTMTPGSADAVASSPIPTQTAEASPTRRVTPKPTGETAKPGSTATPPPTLSYNQEANPQGTPRVSQDQKEEAGFLALGDSYTIGHNVDVSERWPVQLTHRLREEGAKLTEPEIVARTGWTTEELSEAIDAAELRGPYRLVTLLIGVNNQYRGRNVIGYRTEYVALLQRAVAFAGGEPSHVIVLSIPDWSVTPFAESLDRDQISAEIGQFNTVNKEETARIGARYVDITPVSLEAEADPSLLANDGLHPSGKMYTMWTDLVLPEAREVLTPAMND